MQRADRIAGLLKIGGIRVGRMPCACFDITSLMLPKAHSPQPCARFSWKQIAEMSSA